MYEDLKSRLHQLAKMEPHDNGMGIFLISAEGVNAIRGCAAEAADAIEAMNMKLLGDNAAITGMKREIERMVTESSDLNKRLMAVTLELNRATKHLCEWCGVCPEDKRDARDCEIAMLDNERPPTAGGVTPYERTAPQAAAHERRRYPEGVPSGEGPEETAEDPRG